MKYDKAPWSVAAVALTVCLLLSGAAFSADEWPQVVRQVASAYPEGSGTLKPILSEAEREGVAASGVSMILARCASASVRAEDFGAYVARLARARREGLPVHPLTEKILEGLAKDVSPELIVQVLERRMETYRKALMIVGRDAGEAAVEAVSLAMERGVTPSLIQDLFGGAPPDQDVIRRSAQAFADLKDMGFSDAQGLRMVRAGIASGYFKQGDPAFLLRISTAVKAGRSQDEIADAVEGGLRRGETMSGIAQGLQGGFSPGSSGGGSMRGPNGGAAGGGTAGGAGSGYGGGGPRGGRR